MPIVGKSAGKSKFNLKGFKILPKLFIVFSAAAMVFTVSHLILLRSHKQQAKHKISKGNQFAPDSLIADTIKKKLTNNIADSLSLAKYIVADSLRNNGSGYHKIANAPTANGDFKNKPATPGKSTGNLVKPLLSKSQFVANRRSNNKLTNGFSTGKKGLTNSLLGTGKKKGLLSAVVSDSMFRSHYSEWEVTKLKSNESTVNNLNPDYPSLNKTALQSGLSAMLIGSASNKIQSSGLLLKASSGDPKMIKDKKVKPNNVSVSKVDWGVLMGANGSGSFKSAKQHANFYGSLPVDIYIGLFGSYNLNNKWAISSQVQILSPQNITSNYTHANESKADSSQSLKITTSGKLYSVNIPLYLVYKAANNVTIKAGPVIGIPIKQTGINSTLQPYGIRSDSTYYSKTMAILNASKYEQKFNLGVSGGVSVQIKRFIFEATYLKNLKDYTVINDLGSYKSGNGTVQLSIGFQLNKLKR
ncbi:hypothetical protein MuYL_0866 [Mucilaginibacter xinganensis]|uniref:Outer membrane protein beta-barrel domain-containing protein n=1 Tax=Mucilaginibacter xinganensis TaxID=1234841 RepID=A0A223NSH1_9SPHI|nr:hypothetical protein MuYL_0866 [Mucilaginibacter xinganensis]